MLAGSSLLPLADAAGGEPASSQARMNADQDVAYMFEAHGPDLVVRSAGSSQLGPALQPETIGEFARQGNARPSIANADQRAVFEEYGLVESERAVYSRGAGRKMEAEVPRFAESTGSHAAYVWMRQVGAVRSPLHSYVYLAGSPTDLHAAVAADVTVARCRNYVFRFRGPAPGFVEFERLFHSLKTVAPENPESREWRAWDAGSLERWLLGPASLRAFAKRVPVVVAALRAGAIGKSVRRETPAGPVDLIVFEYPDDDTAIQRLAAFQALAGAAADRVGCPIGVIFDAPDLATASALLTGIGRVREHPVAERTGEFDPRRRWHWAAMLAAAAAGMALRLLWRTSRQPI